MMLEESDDGRVLAGELSLLMPLAREAWPNATDTWRLSLMQLTVQVFEFQQPHPTDEHAAALVALEAAMLSLSRSHREARR